MSIASFRQIVFGSTGINSAGAFRQLSSVGLTEISARLLEGGDWTIWN